MNGGTGLVGALGHMQVRSSMRVVGQRELALGGVYA